DAVRDGRSEHHAGACDLTARRGRVRQMTRLPER
ncbi:MAG: hypothetical protein ACI9ZH_002392, partial [Paracoccaceae bacterium]